MKKTKADLMVDLNRELDGLYRTLDDRLDQALDRLRQEGAGISQYMQDVERIGDTYARVNALELMVDRLAASE